MVYRHILTLANRCFERNDLLRRTIQTPRDVEERVTYIRQTFLDLIGGLPEESTPLYPQTVGHVDRETYVIEKVIFSSRPGFLVTANLYLPRGRDWPVPGILIPCGHSPNGKVYESYQCLCVGLVQKGYVVLIYDPLGQGERSQYWDPVTSTSRIGVGVEQHEYAGVQSLLVGVNLAAYRVWDGIRALDYLVSRDEVDPEAIGCTGCSGGGTLTSYLMVLDERIKVAVPVCYLTSRRRWLETGEIADAEQVQDRVIELGIDHAELCISFAPQPLMIAAAERDFFPIQGTRETFEEVRRCYAILGMENRLTLVVDDVEHGYSPRLRRAAYSWFNRWFEKVEEGSEETPFTPEPDETLQCCDEGQVHTHNSRTVFNFTRQLALSLLPESPPPKNLRAVTLFQHDLRERLRRLLRIQASPAPLEVTSRGIVELEHDVGSRRVERLIYESEPGILIPTLVFHPYEGSPLYPTIVYVHGEGKAHDAEEQGLIDTLVAEGYMVFAPDVRGVGETRSHDTISGSYKRMGVEGYHFYNYGMVGENLLGRRVFDLLRLLDLIDRRDDCDPAQISVAGVGMGALLALFAGALDRRFSTVACEGMPTSYKAIAMSEYYDHHPHLFIPGVLKECDLPHVAAGVAPRQLTLTGSLDAEGRVVTTAELEQVYTYTQEVYRVCGGEERLNLSGV
jgi:cephalosporin-C deacetylase-like acetyl esterase